MRRVSLVRLGFVAVAAATVAATTMSWAETSDTYAPQDAAPAVLSPPVIVEAEEPRYVAPTTRDRIGRIWAPVMINGKGPYRLVLDTGASTSAIIPSVAKSLGVPLHESKRVQLHGVTGSAVVPTITANSFEVGEMFMDGVLLPVVADVFGGADGVLGPEGLGNKRIHIDFTNDQIHIQRSSGKSPSADFARVPVKFSENRLLMFEILVGTVRTTAILDTGAQLTLGNSNLREALLRRRLEGVDKTIIGVTLDEQQGKSFEVPRIVMPGFEIRNMPVVFGDVFIFEQLKMTDQPTMLIGMDFIGTLDTLVIDYKMRELHLRPRNWVFQ